MGVNIIALIPTIGFMKFLIPNTTFGNQKLMHMIIQFPNIIALCFLLD